MERDLYSEVGVVLRRVRRAFESVCESKAKEIDVATKRFDCDDDEGIDQVTTPMKCSASFPMRVCFDSFCTCEGESGFHAVDSMLSLSKSENPAVFQVSTRAQLLELSRIVFVLKEAHRLLEERRPCNQRELYYTAIGQLGGKTLVPTQAALNRSIAKVCDLLNVHRHELLINTTARGLVACGPGPVLAVDREGGVIADLRRVTNINEDLVSGLASGECNIKPVGIPGMSGARESLPRVLLIVEKDTLFSHLTNTPSFFQNVPCLLVTACGYPDNLTVRFVNALLTRYPFLTAVYVGDFDPHGILIYLTYCRQVGHPIAHAGLGQSDIEAAGFQYLGLKLSLNDRKTIRAARDRCHSESHIMSELDCMERSRMKYEVECLHSLGSEYMAREWLPMKLSALIDIHHGDGE